MCVHLDIPQCDKLDRQKVGRTDGEKSCINIAHHLCWRAIKLIKIINALSNTMDKNTWNSPAIMCSGLTICME